MTNTGMAGGHSHFCLSDFLFFQKIIPLFHRYGMIKLPFQQRPERPGLCMYTVYIYLYHHSLNCNNLSSKHGKEIHMPFDTLPNRQAETKTEIQRKNWKKTHLQTRSVGR